MKRNGRAVRLLRTWREDYARRTLLSAGASFACTALFAVYNGYLGIRCGSVWHKSIAGFYLLLTAVRGSALLTERRVRARPAPEQERCRRTFLVSSVLLLVLDLALILPVSMMVVLEKPVDLGLIPAIAMAAYTTWKVTAASLHIGRLRRNPGGNILLAELRTVNFIDALVAVLTLQNTLIMVERTAADENGMLPLSAVSSGVIWAAIVAITLRMLQKGLEETKP